MCCLFVEITYKSNFTLIGLDVNTLNRVIWSVHAETSYSTSGVSVGCCETCPDQSLDWCGKLSSLYHLLAEHSRRSMSEVHVHQRPRRWGKCIVQSTVSWKLFRGIASLKWNEGQGYRIQPSLYPFVYNVLTLKVMCATPDRCSVVLLGVGFHYNCLLKTTERSPCIMDTKSRDAL